MVQLPNIISSLLRNPWFVVGGTLFLQWLLNKILDFLPNNIRYRIKYNIKSFKKWFFNSPINITYSVKTTDLEIPSNEYVYVIKELFKLLGYKFSNQKGNTINFNIKYGDILPEISISPSHNNEDKLDILITDLQIDFILKTKFRNFKGDINDLDKLKQQLNDQIKAELNEVYGVSLTCYLKGMYKLTGILENIKLKSLHGVLGHNKIELFDDRMIIYDTILEKELTKIKKIITYYY